MPAITTTAILAATALATAATTASAYGEATGQGWSYGVEDSFSPDIPDPTIPDPVAQTSTLGAAQAEERSLINRAGLAGTKKVRTLLGLSLIHI